jgi:nitrate/nitrite-specific signal transduction histidine kinase
MGHDTRAVVEGGLAALLVTAPISGLCGWLTSRPLVQRIGALSGAIGRFARGGCDLRLPLGRPNEIGRLERQFNAMADQLVASMAERQALAAANTLMQDRARISRELHDSIMPAGFQSCCHRS